MINTNLAGKKNICLVGFMFSGKTSIGTMLAKSLKYKFIDTDFEIEKENYLRIRDIFDCFGEGLFRELEHKKIVEMCNKQKQILSIGGGAFCFDRNIEVIKEKCIVFYLNASFETIMSRTTEKGLEKRPLFNDLKKAEEMFKSRQKFYLKADFVINTDNKELKVVKKEIKNILKTLNKR